MSRGGVRDSIIRHTEKVAGDVRVHDSGSDGWNVGCVGCVY